MIKEGRFEDALSVARQQVEQTTTTKLSRAVRKVERQLGIQVQPDGVLMGPKEQARRARDALKNKNQPKKRGLLAGNNTHLTRNVALEIDTTVVQAPGLKVTEEEQTLANEGLLEYTFQVDLKCKNNSTEISLFQEFVKKVTDADASTRFLPWQGADGGSPDLNNKKLPYIAIKGQVKLRHYIGGLNRARGRMYGRVKVQSKQDFNGLKDGIVDWLRKDLHWVKADYIQAKRVSNIGLLTGTYIVVDLRRTREALEKAVMAEIQREVKLDLKLRKIRCKNRRGNNVTAAIYGVAVDARQVSEAVKGLRSVLHDNCRSPTGRRMHLLTRSSNNEIIEEKTNMALTSHYESVVSDKRLYRKIGVNLTDSVTLKGGQQVTVQQALCSIPSSGGSNFSPGLNAWATQRQWFSPFTKSTTRRQEKQYTSCTKSYRVS